MLPPALVSVYHEYKKDTNSIASWLASTAKECGYPAHLLSNTPVSVTKQQTAGAGRLKGKARAEAKKRAKAAPNKPAPSKEGPRYVIEIKDFVPLAESISNYKKPALAIPQAFFSTLNRVISVRNGFSEQLLRHNEKPDVKSDARHSYFVGILEKVREILKPFADSAASTSTDTIDRLANTFDALEVYEPSEEFLNAPDIQRPEPTKKEEAIYEVDPSQSFDEAVIAFCMMCKDLAEVRKYISNLWSEFVSQENGAPSDDPGVLAVVTNTAVEFGRSIAEDAMPAFQKHGGTTAMAREYMLRTTAWNGEAGSDFEPYLKDPSTGHGFYDALSHCYYLTETTLLTLSLVPWRGVTSIYSEGSFGVCQPEIPWKSKTVEQKMTDHQVITTELWFEALALVHHVPDYPCTDEFIRGVKEFKETKKVPFSLVFAAQVNLDIHQVVGSYAESSVNTLLNRIDSMNQDLKSHINFQQGIKGPHWSPRDDKWLKVTQEGFDWFLDDPLHKAKTMANDNSSTRQEGLIHLARTKKWRILRRSPVIAGLALYYHRAEMHEAGLKVTNAWGSLILPGHLYNALLKEQCIKSNWVDMGTLFGVFGEEQFFVGGRPDKVSDYATRFMLQIGVSAAAFTKNRRRGPKMVVEDFSRAGARFLTSRASIHKSLQDRYQRNANRMNWTAESISEILLRAESEGKGKGKRTVPLASQDIRISPVGVLSSLVTAMQGEVRELAFGYLPMHRMSWKILRAVRTRCDPYFKETYGSDFTLKEWELPFMVGHILPLAPDESMDMLRTAGKVWDKLNYGDTMSIGMRRMYELSGIDYGISGIHNQLFQGFTNPHGSLVDDGLDYESEESDDENFSVTMHEVNMVTGQVSSRKERIKTLASDNQQLEQ
ncbi:hypothetical protein FPANT_1095 [Fusarium pseudoanthophilum]|uniref:DUF6604 domain-containing protein n=1 Tax=Fusarium pseudoanthophilum TaxID=48495 RepID=A0A8H5PYU4_9HYPO|nr:hypothetical protein FPANT_1095 [Fusarium pseudoanthophilum]